MKKAPKRADIITDAELHEAAEMQAAIFVLERKMHETNAGLVRRLKAGARVDSPRYYIDLEFGGVRGRKQVNQWSVVTGGKAVNDE